MTVFQSIKVALAGLKVALRHERNFRIQVVLFIVVLIAGIIFPLTAQEWIFIFLCAAMVLSLEVMNSAIEKLCDFVSPDIHPSIKKIKDFSAAAVLIAALFSLTIGCLIFFPKIVALIDR